MRRADHRCCLSTRVWEKTCVIARDQENYMTRPDTKLLQQRMLMDPHRPSCNGYSILELIEAELDVVFERLKSGDGAAADGRDPGRAEGLCVAIAYIRNPYRPDIDLPKAMAVERWEAKLAELEKADAAREAEDPGHLEDAAALEEAESADSE